MSIFTIEQWAVFNRTSVTQVTEQFNRIKETFIAGNVGKSTRPWLVVNFPELFAAEETLVGFEIETGFNNRDHATSFLTWLWNNTDYVTADREGCGSIPVEITFPPIPLRDLLDGNTQIHEMFGHNSQLSPEQRLVTSTVTAQRPTGGSVGTHTNISTAAYRALDNTQKPLVAGRLVTLFHELSASQRYQLYGRQPYMDSVAQRRGGSASDAGAARIEFKMFHTTTNLEQFNNYIKVSARLAQVIDFFSEDAASQQVREVTVARFFDFLTQDLEGRSVISRSNLTQYSQHTLRYRSEGYSPSSNPEPVSLAA